VGETVELVMIILGEKIPSSVGSLKDFTTLCKICLFSTSPAETLWKFSGISIAKGSNETSCVLLDHPHHARSKSDAHAQINR